MQKLFCKLPFVSAQSAQPAVPERYRSQFHHLIWDMAWYGLLAGATIAFLNVYAARLGASAFQIGMLTAGPALVNLLFTLPFGRWLQSRPIGSAVFWAAVASRSLFLVYAFLPLLLPEQAQVQVLIWTTLLFSIPATILAIGFNALFATAVPPEWRGYVVGRRNATISLVYIATSLLSGYILNPNLFFYLVTSVVGGQGWALVGGGLANYLLEKVPPGDRPAYLAWYNLALNAAILLGALLGPLFAAWFGLTIALVLAFVFRLAGSIFIWYVEPRDLTKNAA